MLAIGKTVLAKTGSNLDQQYERLETVVGTKPR
jgi:hypothetical protein